jgi:RNA polymerase sigma-70 factor, ECF subfamily
MVSFETEQVGPDTKQKEIFLDLVDRYGRALRRLTQVYVQSAADQEDLFQEILLAIWTALPRFRRESSERTWLYRIGHNVALTHVIKIRQKASRELPQDEQVYAVRAKDNLEAGLIDRQNRRRLIEAIRVLPSLDQQILMLHLEGLSYAEMEEVTGLTSSNLGVRLTRARRRLSEWMQKVEVKI